jgi:hypothetical protein
MIFKIMPKRPEPPRPMDLAERQIKEIQAFVGQSVLTQEEATALSQEILMNAAEAEVRRLAKEQEKKAQEIIRQKVSRLFSHQTR